MRRMIITYTVKPHLVAENQAAIERVFAEVQAQGLEGVRYAAFKAADGVSFVHLVSLETESGANPLEQSPAFQAFQGGIGERCVAPPVVTVLDEVGTYRVFET